MNAKTKLLFGVITLICLLSLVFNGILLGRGNSSVSEDNAVLNDSITALNREITNQKAALSVAQDSNKVLSSDIGELLKEIDHGIRENKSIKDINHLVIENAKQDIKK